MNPHYPPVAERARHCCECCGAPEAAFNFPFEVEHIIPPLFGGDSNHRNLALACRACNVHKAAFLEGIDPENGRSVQLFNPRRNTWMDHFEVDLQTGLICGKTSTGRATIDRLQMNSRMQQHARLQWLMLGLFSGA